MSQQEEALENLNRVRERTVSEIARLRSALQEAIEPASASDDDAADVAADIYERGKIISLSQNLESKVQALDHAIDMAQQGMYGICEKCGVQIPQERLDIMPETVFCVRCATEREQGYRRSRAPSRSRGRASRYMDDSSDASEENDNDSDD